MVIRRRLPFIAIAIFLLLAECKKYPEGPAFSLRTKKARLAGEWQLAQAIRGGLDSTEYYKAVLGSNYRLIIKKYEIYWIYGNYPGDGTWRLSEDKTTIYFKPTLQSAPELSYQIMRLKNRELWLRDVDSRGNIRDTKYFQ
jgi:hypothetical protein